MSIVSEYNWESDSWTHNGDNPTRQAFRQAVAEIAAKAKETLPECNGRVDAAVKIVLNGDVEQLDDGTARVASQSNGTTVYHVVNGECTCKDFPKSPSGWCKHRIAAGLYKRVTALMQRKLAQSDGASNGQAEPPSQPSPVQPAAPTPPLPEVPAIVSTVLTIDGRRIEVKLCDTDDARLLQRLARLLAQYPSEPSATNSPPAADLTPQCPTHGPMKPSTRGKGWFCPTKLSDGTWCKGR
jgi:hypothetical protein